MATDPSAQHRSQRPQLNKFILALFLVKSKAANTTIHGKSSFRISQCVTNGLVLDHLSRLKSFIRDGTRASNERAGKRHVNSVGYWQDAHRKSEATHDELRVRVAELEQQLAKQSPPAKGPSSQAKAQGKRKRNEEDGVEGPTSKSMKLGNTTSSAVTAVDGQQSLAEMALSLGVDEDSYVSLLLHDIHMLRRTSIQRPIVLVDCTNHFTHVCLDIRRLIASIETPMQMPASTEPKDRKSTRTQALPSTHVRADKSDQAESQLNAIARIFPLLLNTVDQLGQSVEGTEYSNLAVYHILTMLQDILDRLCLLCATEGREKHAASLRTTKPRGRLGKEIANFLKAPQEGHHSGSDVQTTTLLTQLGIAILDALNLFRDVDKDILDGFLFFLLTRAGNLLGDFAFLDRDKENLNPASAVPNTEAVAIRHAQAPHILRLVKHALVLAANIPAPPVPGPRLKIRVPSLQVQGLQSSHNGISRQARLRLQNTLLRGVFGEDVTGLGEGLRKPEGIYGADARRKEGGDVGFWFVNEVWKTVGWDVLKEVVAWK